MGQHGLSYRKRRVNGAVHHVSLSLLLLATEFITILMKFPRDKQQKKKVAKVGQDEDKTRTRGEESREERRRPAVSAFISIHILFVVFILSNP